jgi:hypothetical protein
MVARPETSKGKEKLPNGSSRNIMKIISTLLRAMAIIGLGIAILFIALGQLWIYPLGRVSPITVGAVCGLYFLMDRRLEKDGVSRGQAIVLAILFANVFAQSFEMVYRFSFPIYLNYFKPPFLDGDGVKYLAMESIMLLPILLVRRHLRFGAISAILGSSFVMVWAVWILYGYPQYYALTYYYPQIIFSNDPFHLSLWINFGSKTILALFFASIIQRRTSQP